MKKCPGGERFGSYDGVIAEASSFYERLEQWLFFREETKDRITLDLVYLTAM